MHWGRPFAGRALRLAGGAFASTFDVWNIDLWIVKKKKIIKAFKAADNWGCPAGFSADGKGFVLAKKRAEPAPAYDLVYWDIEKLAQTKTLRRAVENGGVVDVHHVPGTDIWYGGIRLESSREQTPLVRFWEFSSNKEIKTIGIDTKRRSTDNKRLFDHAVSWNSKFALVTSGANRDSESDPIRNTVWDLESGKIGRSWDDPTRL